MFLEVVSKPRITPAGKAQSDSKAQHTRQYVSISSGLQRRPRGVRRDNEPSSKYGTGIAGLSTSKLMKEIQPVFLLIQK
jgi:hypothetical protein